VDKLQSQGINVQDINKLKAAGICTVLSVSQTTRRNLLKIKGLSEAKVEKLKEAAAKMLPPTFATAAEIGLRREACIMITTGSKTVDAMLGGGSVAILQNPVHLTLTSKWGRRGTDRESY
jgi:meiotic recombination protein DMC1